MLHIEMLKAVVAGIVEKNHDEHDFRLRKRTVTVIFALGRGFYGIFFHQTVKNLQNSFAIKKNSVTLSSVFRNQAKRCYTKFSGFSL